MLRPLLVVQQWGVLKLRKNITVLCIGVLSIFLSFNSILAWWDSDYDYRYPIYNNYTNSEVVIAINGTGGVCGTIYWARIFNSSVDPTYIYCEDSGCCSGEVAIANDTDEKPYERESDRTGNDINLLWDNNVVSVYHMNDESGIIYDSSPSNYNLTVSSAPVEKDTLLGKAQFFDGSDDYYTISSADCPNCDGMATMSIEVWLNHSKASDYGSVVNFWRTDGNPGAYLIRVDNQNPATITTQVRTSVTAKEKATSGTVSILNWYHCVLVYNGSHIVNYLNGIEDSTETLTGTVLTDASSNFRVGTRTASNYPFDGEITEVRLYNSTLTDTQIKASYYSGLNNMTSIGVEEEYSPADSTPPVWQDVEENNVDPSTYPYDGTQNYGFSVNFTDETAMKNVTFIHNLTGSWEGFNCSQSGDIFYYNITSMGVGVLNYTFIGYDTSNNPNQTDYYTFTLNKGTPYYDIVGSVPHGSFNKTYEQQAQIWVSDYDNNEGDSDITYSLFRNGTFIAGLYDSTTILGVGAYLYLANNTEGQNYTSTSTDQIVLVNQRTPNLPILNTSNGIYPLNQTIYFTIDDINGLTGTIYKNGTSFTNNTDPALTIGLWNITAHTSGNTNYTSSSNTTWVLISHAEGEDLFNVTSVTFGEFVNETATHEFETTMYYNRYYIDNITSSLFWNGTEYIATNTFSNTTHYIFKRNITMPLLMENNTEVSFNFNNTFHLSLNDTYIEEEDDSYNQNITYAYFIDSFDSDSSNYAEGEDSDLELYVVDLLGRANLTANFTFYYNGSYWDTDNTTSYSTVGGLKLFETTFNTLQNTNNTETKTIIGNLTIRYGSNQRVMGEEDTVDVYKMIITECGDITNTTTLVVSYWEELNFTARNGSLGLIRFLLTSGDVEREYSFENTTSAPNHTFCIYPDWATHNAFIYIEYEDSDTPRRPYYVVDTYLSDESEEIKAFLLNDTYAYYTNIYLYDENGASMPQHYIRIQKYNDEIDASETLFIGRTDDSGIFATFLQPLEQPYSYVVTDSDGEILYQSIMEVINCISGTCPPYEKHIYIDPLEQEYINIGDIQALYSWNETTSTLTMTISDTDGLVNSIWVKIDEVGDFGRRTNYFNQTYDTATLSFSEVLPNTTEEYEVSVKVEEFGEWYPLITRSITMENVMMLGVLGVIISFVMILGLEVGGLMVGGPVLGLVGVGSGLFVARIFNLIPLPFVGLYSVIFVIGMIIYLLIKGD